MPDDGFRYELVKGELWRMIPVENVHGRVAMNVGISLGGYVKAHDLGAVYAAETGFNLVGDPDTVRAPDVEEKVFDWLEAGTKMVVVINARQRSAILYKSPPTSLPSPKPTSWPAETSSLRSGRSSRNLRLSHVSRC
jgi:hypothetical protein